MHDDNALFSEFGMKLWRKMSQDLNYNVMFSPRGIINLAHSELRTKNWPRVRALITRYHPHASHAQPAKHTVPDEFNEESQSTLLGCSPLLILNQIVNLQFMSI